MHLYARMHVGTRVGMRVSIYRFIYLENGRCCLCAHTEVVYRARPGAQLQVGHVLLELPLVTASGEATDDDTGGDDVGDDGRGNEC